MFKIVHGLFYFPTGIFVEQAPTELQDHSIISPLSVPMHTQVTSIIPLYLVLFVTSIHFLHMFPWLVFCIYHYLHAKLAIIVLYCVSFAFVANRYSAK